MQQQYIISYVGVDRPGLVDQISRIIHQVQGSWQSSRSVNLAGMFSGMVQISLPTSEEQNLKDSLHKLESESLQISLIPILAQGKANESLLEVRVMGADRTGIVKEFSSILSGLGANLEELETDIGPAPMSGELTFTAIARVSIPENLDIDRIREALEDLSDDLIVELNTI